EEVADADAQVVNRLVPDFRRQRVAAPRGLGDRLRGDFNVSQRRKGAGRACGETFARAPRDARPRTEGFETAARAAAACGAFRQHGHVSDLARAVVYAVDELAAHDDAAADAGRDGDVDQVPQPAARAVTVLAECGGVGVVV